MKTNKSRHTVRYCDKMRIFDSSSGLGLIFAFAAAPRHMFEYEINLLQIPGDW